MMNRFDNVTITDIDDVAVVSSIKGEPFSMKDRPSFGLSFSKSGRIVYRMNGIDTVSEPGIGVIIPMGSDYDLIREKTGEFTLINFKAEGLPTDRFLSFPVEGEEAIHSLFDTLFHALAIEKNRLRAIRLLYEILEWAGNVNEGPYTVLTAAEKYMNAHLSDPSLDNRTVAASTHISECYFRKLFREKWGISPRHYIIEARLELARRMLIGSSKSIGEIAHTCGFADVYHFSRSFRTETGITPSEYRATNRGM